MGLDVIEKVAYLVDDLVRKNRIEVRPYIRVITLRILEEHFLSVVEYGSMQQMLYARKVFIINDIKVDIRIVFRNVQYLLYVKFSFVRRHVIDNVGEDDFTIFDVFHQGGL